METDSPLPTPAELEILAVLWARGPSTVAEVREVLERERPTGYTTALKLLQIMHSKGMVTRDESARRHVYDAWALRRSVQQDLIEDLADRAFDGSIAGLVVRALSVLPPSVEEIQTIRKQLDRVERLVRINS